MSSGYTEDPTPAEQAGPYFIPDQLTFGLLFRAMLQSWRLVAAIAGCMVLLGVVYYEFVRAPAYEATAVIGPSAGMSQMSGGGLLGSLSAGFGMNGGDEFGRYRQIIQSDRLAGYLEKKQGWMRRIMLGWDPKTRASHPNTGLVTRAVIGVKKLFGIPVTPPDETAFAALLDRIVTVTALGGDTPLRPSVYYNVSVTVAGRQNAIDLLHDILLDSDQLARQDQIVSIRNRIVYLRDALQKTSEVNLQNGLQQLLLTQEQTLMSLEADRTWAFDLIDPPQAPPWPTGPGVAVVSLVLAFAGVLVSAGVIYLLLLRRLSEMAGYEEDPLEEPLMDIRRWTADRIAGPIARTLNLRYDRT